MGRRKQNITSVTFTYVGTDADFDRFLTTLVRDYLAVENLHTTLTENLVGKVETKPA